MNTKPGISIALATYNGEQYIQQQLNSIFTQTYLPSEIVVCDDASTDSTYDILLNFKKNYPRTLRLYQNSSNIGVNKIFEQAISLCKYDIIVISDQDDVWLPNRLERIMNVFSEYHACDMLFTDAIVVDNNLRSLGYTVNARFYKSIHGKVSKVSKLSSDGMMKGCTIAFRSNWRKYLLPIVSQFWGYDSWIIYIMRIISTIYMVDEPLMLHRRHGSNLSSNPRLERRFSLIVQKAFENMRESSYIRKYHLWNDMLKYLESLMEKNKQGSFDLLEKLENGIKKTKKRVIFEEGRLSLRKMNRLRRFMPVLGLFLNYEYKNNGYSLRNILVDLVA